MRETYPLGERRIIHSEERKEGKKGKMYIEEMDTHKSGQEELRQIEWTGREEINHDGNAKPDQIVLSITVCTLGHILKHFWLSGVDWTSRGRAYKDLASRKKSRARKRERKRHLFP